MDVFVIKQGNTSPAFKLALTPTTVDVTGATLRFRMRRAAGDFATTIEAAAAAVTAEPPVVEYQWQAGDTDEVGSFEAEVEVTYPSGRVETFPNKGWFPVLISPAA